MNVLNGTRLNFIDFEFNNSKNEHPTLVSYADEVDTSWLHGGYGNELLKVTLLLRKKNIFVAYAATAEARCFLALGLEPTEFKWIDLYLEYCHLLNHNHRLAYGRQLKKGKVVRTTPPPRNKWDLTEEEKKRQDNSKPEKGYAAACFKLLGEMVDTKEKDEVRDLIISAPLEFTAEERARILKYNKSDIKFLPRLLEAILNEYKRLLGKEYNEERLIKEMLYRGEYAARTAKMESIGYPINMEMTKNFSDSVGKILFQTQKEINDLFPDIAPFRLKRDYTYSLTEKKVRDWIESTGLAPKWMKTKTKQLSLSMDAFKRHYDFRHNYPKDNFGAQMVRFLTLKQNINGFSPTAKNSFWDYVGDDGRVRPYFGIYGAQSSRSQPKATGYLFLKSAWMRVMCQPVAGRAIGAIDYGQQEFLIMGLEANDISMIEAYYSGDPYLFFAKAGKAVPQDATKKSHGQVRDMFKGTTLSKQFGQKAEGMSVKLTNDLGYAVTVLDCQKIIDLFDRVFPKVEPHKDKIYQKYIAKRKLKLPDGWYMWGDNANGLSVKNFPIQGIGASIMRRAVRYAQEDGLDVILTLHDALYIEFDSDKAVESMSKLADCMQRAFQDHYKKHEGKYKIKMDGNIWSPDYSEEYINIEGLGKVKVQNEYIDERGAKEYEFFKQCFKPEAVPEDL